MNQKFESNDINVESNDINFERNDINFETHFSLKCSTNTKTTNQLLGYFWIDENIFILISQQYIEIYYLKSEISDGMSKFYKHSEVEISINWWLYSANIKILMVSLSGAANKMQSYYLDCKSKEILISLHKFKLDLASSHLSKANFYLQKIYYHVFCIIVEQDLHQISFYFLTQSQAKIYLTIECEAGDNLSLLKLSFVDNLVLLHNFNLHKTLVYDIKLKPLGSNKITTPIYSLNLTDLENQSTFLKFILFTIFQIYSQFLADLLLNYHVKFLNPDLFVNRLNGKIKKICLNNSFHIPHFDTSQTASFLLRRKRGKLVLLSKLKSMIVERVDIREIHEIFNTINAIVAIYESEKNTKSPNLRDLKSKENKEKTIPESKRAENYFQFFKKASLTNLKFKVTNSSNSENNSNSENSENNNKSGNNSDDSKSGNNSEVKKSLSLLDLNLISEHVSPYSSFDMFPLVESNFEQLENETSKGLKVITQQEMYTLLFLPCEDANVDYRIMIIILTTYLTSLVQYNLPSESYIHELLIDLLVRNKKFYQLHHLLQYHIISDSLHVACQLLYLESMYPPSLQLALDMFKRLGEFHHFLEVLLTKGNIIYAIKFLQLIKIRESDIKRIVIRFLAEAKSTGNVNLFFTTYNFFDQKKLILSPLHDSYISYYKELFETINLSK